MSHSKVHSVCMLYRPGEWQWVDCNCTNGKPTFPRHVNLSRLSAICNHFGEIAAWSRKSLTMFTQKLIDLFFGKKRPLASKFSRMFSERIHGDIDPCLVCKFREIWLTGNRWNRALLTRQKKQNFASRFCADSVIPVTVFQLQLQLQLVFFYFSVTITITIKWY